MVPDVIVIGGGVAGASCALALARQGAQVILIEGEPVTRWKIGETLGPEAIKYQRPIKAI